MAQRLDVVHVEDYVCYYLDGEVFYQHHSMDDRDIVEMMMEHKPTEAHWYWYNKADDEEEELERFGYMFPESFDDIPESCLTEYK